MSYEQKAWTAVTVDALNSKGSWTGRMHIHKLLFILKAVRHEDVPFEFELYHYGPYSFLLDRTIAEMETFGELGKSYRAPGYGPSYTLPEGSDEFRQLKQHQIDVIGECAAILGDLDSKELELVATALWATEIEMISDENEIVDRVSSIKPKYSRQEIVSRLDSAKKVKGRLLSK